jgi:hypothetical protein
VQIAKTGARAKATSVSRFNRDRIKQQQLPLVLIGLAMLGYVVIVWQWL